MRTRKRPGYHRYVALFACAILLCLSITTAFATGGFNAVPEFGTKVKEFYSLATKIVLPLGALSFAMGAFRMILGSDKAAEGGKKQMIWTAVAVACVYLVPAMVSLGASLGQEHDWASSHGF